jgi:hypothetical protein
LLQVARPKDCLPERRRAMTYLAALSPLLILTQNSAHFKAGADKLQTLIQNFN